MDKDSIKFTPNEQNFLAQLMTIISSHCRNARKTDDISDEAHAIVGDNIAFLATEFPGVDVGQLYDKFHRRGVNR